MSSLATLQDAKEIKVGDYGWDLELDLVDPAIDANSATKLEVLYTKPDGVTTGAWTASPHPIEPTVIVYRVAVDSFDVPGNWVLRARFIDTTNGIQLTGDPVRVRVVD